jgi:hypothetical protein
MKRSSALWFDIPSFSMEDAGIYFEEGGLVICFRLPAQLLHSCERGFVMVNLEHRIVTAKP